MYIYSMFISQLIHEHQDRVIYCQHKVLVVYIEQKCIRNFLLSSLVIPIRFSFIRLLQYTIDYLGQQLLQQLEVSVMLYMTVTICYKSVTSHDNMIIYHTEGYKRFQNNDVIQYVHYMLILQIAYSLYGRLDKVLYRPTSQYI